MDNNKKIQLSINLNKLSAELLTAYSKRIGITIGEFVEEKCIEWTAKDRLTATNLILDALALYTTNLSSEDTNFTMWTLLDILKEWLRMPDGTDFAEFIKLMQLAINSSSEVSTD